MSTRIAGAHEGRVLSGAALMLAILVGLTRCSGEDEEPIVEPPAGPELTEADSGSTFQCRVDDEFDVRLVSSWSADGGSWLVTEISVPSVLQQVGPPKTEPHDGCVGDGCAQDVIFTFACAAQGSSSLAMDYVASGATQRRFTLDVVVE